MQQTNQTNASAATTAQIKSALRELGFENFVISEHEVSAWDATGKRHCIARARLNPAAMNFGRN